MFKMTKYYSLNSWYHKNKRLTYYIVYTFVFIITSLLVFSQFYLNKKSFVWRTDGIDQHLTSLTYFSKYLHQIAKYFLNTGKLIIPLFDFSIGYGSDIPTTLHYLCFGDPLALLSFLIPSSKTVYLYCFLIIFRLYLSGIAFSIYCEKINLSRFAVLCGSLVYTFCGFALFASVRHPFFINPMIYFPLLLIGIEKIFKNQKPYLFIIMVFVSAVSNFYFFYMLSVLMVIYAVIRFFSFFEKKDILKYLKQFSLYYGIGLLMACILFIPVVMLLFSSTRFNIHPIIDILYSKNYYLNFPVSFITTAIDIPGRWTYLGYTCISLIAVILFLFQKKTNSHIKILFILFTIFLMLPIMGYILHGSSYVTNRWIWGYSFIVALITTIMIPYIMKPMKNYIIIIRIFIILYFSYCVFFGNVNSAVFFIPFAIVMFIDLFMYCVNILNIYDNKRILIRITPRIILLALVIINIAISAYYLYSPRYGKYVNEFTGFNEAFTLITGNPSLGLLEINDKQFYRFDEHINAIRNHSMVNQVNSTSSFFSISNPVIFDFFINDMDLWVRTTANYNRLDNRTILSALAGIKYFVVNKESEQYLPYGFDKYIHSSGDNLIYENANVLPLGYTYNNIIAETEYKSLSAIEKQQALIQGAVLNNTTNGEEEDKLANINPLFNHAIIPYNMECGEGIEYLDGVFLVNNASSSVILYFEGLPNCETYLNIKKLNYSERRNQTRITVESEDISKTIIYLTPYNNWYTDQHDFLINLNYAIKKKNEIKINFEYPGTFSFDKLEVICQPVDDFKRQISQLKETVLENVNITQNLITGTISTDKNKLLCLSIPYSKGWRAYIDGKKVDLLRVNTMFSGVLIPIGNHDVKLTYMTPYLKQGCILSFFGFVLFIIVIYYYEKKMKNSKEKKINA